MTWVQPEDLVGHELRQAREEGKDVDGVEERWFEAGGAPAPGRGASQEPVAPELRSLALDLLDELDALPRPLAASEPEGFEEILAAADPVERREASDLPGADRRRVARPRGGLCARQAGREHPPGRHPRDRRGDRQLARAGLVHGRGPAGGGLRTLAVEPGQPPDEPRREHRRHPGGRRPQLHDARRRAARALRHRLRRARRRQDLARLHAAGPDLHRRARRGAEPARGVPAARDGDAAQSVPRVDRRPAARRRVRLGRRRATPSPPRGWRGRTRASATRRTASTRRCSWPRRTRPRSRGRRRRRAPTPVVSVVPAESRLAESLRTARELAGALALGGDGRRALRPLRRLPLGARDQQHCARRGGALRLRRRLLGRDLGGRPGRLGHGHERRRRRLDRRRGRRRRPGSRSAGRRRSAAASRARCPASTGSRWTSSSGGRSPSPARRHRREHPAREAARSARAEADRSADGRAARAGRRSRRRSTPRRSSPHRTIRPTGPPGATRSRRWREPRRRRGSATTTPPTPRRSTPGRRAATSSRSPGSGTSCSSTTSPAASRRSASAPSPSASSAASTGSCSGTRIR